jgi:hypothetical protein
MNNHTHTGEKPVDCIGDILPPLHKRRDESSDSDSDAKNSNSDGDPRQSGQKYGSKTSVCIGSGAHTRGYQDDERDLGGISARKGRENLARNGYSDESSDDDDDDDDDDVSVRDYGSPIGPLMELLRYAYDCCTVCIYVCVCLYAYVCWYVYVGMCMYLCVHLGICGNVLRVFLMTACIYIRIRMHTYT